jgi:hypothetical protein
MATLVALDTDLDVTWIGYFSAMITGGAIAAAIFGAPLVDQLGPIRSSQFMLLT